MRSAFSSVCVALWLSAVVFGLMHLETSIEDFFPWLPNGTPQRTEYLDFLDRFGSDDVVLVSWDGITVDDPRIPELQERFEQAPALENHVNKVITAEDLIAEMLAADSDLTRSAAIAKLQPYLVGEDGHTTAVLVSLSAAGSRSRRKVVEAVLEVCETMPTIRDRLHLGGRPYLGYYSSMIIRRSLITLSIPVVILSTLLAWVSLRRVDMTVMILACAGCSALTGLIIVPCMGYTVNGLLTALPSLVAVVTASGAIHLANYGLKIQRNERPATHHLFERRILERAWKPCALSTASTALGTLSLTWSRFPAIREFGMFATIGIAFSLFVQLWVMPQLLSFVIRRDADGISDYEHAQDPYVRGLDYLLQRILRHHRWVVMGTLLLTAGLSLPLRQLRGQFDVDAIFDDKTDFVQNMRWFEENMGPLDATEVVVTLPRESTSRFMRQIDRIRELDQALQAIPEVGATYSVVSMIPKVEGVMRRILARRMLGSRRDDLLATSFLDEDEKHEYWRITLRTSFFRQSYRTELRNEIGEVAESVTSQWDVPVTYVVTGSSQIVHETQGEVLGDFVSSILMAYVLILILISVALRSLRVGLLAMIPNAIPLLTVFGVLAIIDGKIDLGMTVAACIALGIAVDDTSHLLIRLREAQSDTDNRIDAINIAYHECALAMVQTSLICGVSMMPYQLASLVYLQRFGLVLPLLMGAALLGDLIFLPALIASPVGRWFEHKPRTAKASNDKTNL